ncbi:MAG: hypothetical protein EAZ21_07965 [Betaproteobacteria bacterium]|nr:MAG: hypothetical protein EAZ21_07965 [Betaproteobacteria bacterium]
MLARRRPIAKFYFGIYEALRQLSVESGFSTLATRSLNQQGPSMKYLLLCQIQPASFADVSPDTEAQMMASMMAYNQQLIQAGVLVAAGQLAPADTAQRVFTQKGRIKTEEGNALTGDTQIGGYYLIDVPGETEATGWAAKCPLVHMGSLEVRKVAYAPI